MKVLVIKAFIDKRTGIPYNSGYYYESDDLERIKELQRLGYLEQVSFDEGPEQAVLTKPEKTSKKRKL